MQLCGGGECHTSAGALSTRENGATTPYHVMLPGSRSARPTPQCHRPRCRRTRPRRRRPTATPRTRPRQRTAAACWVTREWTIVLRELHGYGVERMCWTQTHGRTRQTRSDLVSRYAPHGRGQALKLEDGEPALRIEVPHGEDGQLLAEAHPTESLRQHVREAAWVLGRARAELTGCTRMRKPAR